MAIRPAELGTVRLMNLIADCRTTHGSSGSGVQHCSPDRDSRADERELREDQRDDDPRDVGAAKLVGDRAEADVGELRDDQVGGDSDQRRHQELLDADPGHRLELGRLLAAGSGGCSLPQILQSHLVCTSEVAHVGRERRPLEVGQRRPDRVGPTPPSAAFNARSGPTSTVQATSSSATSMSIADCGAPSVAAEKSSSTGPSAVTMTLLRLSLPWEMPASCSRAACSQSSSASRRHLRRQPRAGRRRARA